MTPLPNPGDDAESHRMCRYGHGPLEGEMGSFGLQGLQRYMSEPAEAGRRPVFHYIRDEQRVFLLRIWRCPVCGYVELSDTEV